MSKGRPKGSFASRETTRIPAPKERFGRLTVIGELAQSHVRGHRVFSCQCDCGGTAAVRRDRLIKGITRSCGCIRKEKATAMGAANAAAARGIGRNRGRAWELCEGEVRGRLMLIMPVPADPRPVPSKRMWLCRCIAGPSSNPCGTLCLVRADRLASNPTEAEAIQERADRKAAREAGLEPEPGRNGRRTCGCGKRRFALNMLRRAQAFADATEYDEKQRAIRSQELAERYGL